MKHISESIIGRKSTSVLDFLTKLNGNPEKFNIDKVYDLLCKEFDDGGADLIEDPAAPRKSRWEYKNPSKLMQKVGDWASYKKIRATPIVLDGDLFKLEHKPIHFLYIEYVFRGKSDVAGNYTGYDYDDIANAVAAVLKSIPAVKTTPIIIHPYSRDDSPLGNPIYVINPSKPTIPICLNNILGDKMVNNIDYIIDQQFTN